MKIGNNIHNKESLIRMAVAFLSEKEDGMYVFPVGTNIKLWYYETQEEHLLLSLELGYDKKSVILVSIVNNEREVDNLKEFDFSEIKRILKLVE